MKRRAISKVLIDPSGHLFVFPETDAESHYEYIYREANGLRWDGSMRALCAYEPDRWVHAELLRHMAATLASAFDEELHFTSQTVWLGVPAELQAELRLALP